MSVDRLDELADDLFAAAREERPDPGLVERVSALGVHDRPRPEPAPERRIGLGRSGARRVAVWLAAAALLGAVALGISRIEPESADVKLSAEQRAPRSPEPSPTIVEVRESPAPAPSLAPSPAEEPPTLRTLPSRVPIRVKPERAREPPPAVTAVPAVTAAPVTSLATQVNLLQRARALLRAGDGAAALELLERYDAELHGTDLTAEATLLQIEALASVGRKGDASALARRFVDQNPDSPLVDRAQTFIQ